MSLASWLLIGQVLVVAILAVTVAGVAAVVGPPAFDRHMLMAGHTDPALLRHADEAFRSAGLTALAAGLTVAGLGALMASILLSSRIRAALTALAAGAARVADGDYATPVALPIADRELASVARSFDTMAGRLADVEANRRRMLTDLSHELRTPLAAVEVVLEGIEDGVVPADAATIATLRAQTARITRLVADIREVSAAEEGRLGLTRYLVDAAAGTARPQLAARGVRLTVAPVPDAVVDVDRARLGQVLDNLLRNAAQHTASGDEVLLWAEVSDAAVQIGVRDNGAGIGPDDLPHVFERFYRGGSRRHDEGAGTGVGLAISRAIVTAHGGTLTAASDGPGLGSEFVIALPRA